MSHSVIAFAPASVSNLSCGFDLLGFPVEGVGDRVIARLRPERGVELARITGDGGALPKDAARNTATVAVARLLLQLGREDVGVTLELDKGLPLASGLGSSAASAVAGAFAVNELLGRPASLEVLLACAVEGERVACGAAHADNAAPSLYGGFVLVRGGARPRVDPLPVPEGLHCAVVHPHLTVSTREAREKLPAQVDRGTAVEQAGNLAAFVSGLAAGDAQRMRSGLVDLIAEPARSGAIPGYDAAVAAAMRTGAIGAGLSGSGPTLYALAQGREGGQRAADVMATVLREASGADCDVWVTPVGARGAHVVAE